MADLHFGPDSFKAYSALFKSAGAESDIIILCGDLTMRGLVEEARGLVEAMSGVKRPNYQRAREPRPRGQ